MDVMSFVIPVTGVLLNTAAFIYILVKQRHNLTTYTRACLNMVIADLLYAVVGVTAALLPKMEDEGRTTTVKCTIWVLVNNIATISDLLCIVPVTTDRILAVFFPYRYNAKAHKRLILIVILLCWGFASANESVKTIILTILNGTPTSLRMGLCTINMQKDQMSVLKTVTLIKHVVMMPIPLLYNIISYTSIIIKLITPPSSSASHAAQNTSLRVNRNVIICVAKAIITSVIFTISWMPTFLGYHGLIQISNLDRYKKISDTFLYLNTCSDPLIYIIPNKIILKCFWSNRNMSDKTGSDKIPLPKTVPSTVVQEQDKD